MITFNPNIEEQVKGDIVQTFGLSNDKSYDKYIRLPTVIKKNKRSNFESIINIG